MIWIYYRTIKRGFTVPGFLFKQKFKKKRPNRLTRFTVDGRVNVAEYPRAKNFAELKTVPGVRQVVHVQSVGAEFLCAAVSHGATAASACILRRSCARTLYSFRFRSVVENCGCCVMCARVVQRIRWKTDGDE